MNSVRFVPSTATKVVTNRIGGDFLALGHVRGGKPLGELTQRQRAKILAVVQARGVAFTTCRVNNRRRLALLEEQRQHRLALEALREELRLYTSVGVIGPSRKAPRQLEEDISQREQTLAQLDRSIAELVRETERQQEIASGLTELRERLLRHPLVASNQAFLREIDLWEAEQP